MHISIGSDALRLSRPPNQSLVTAGLFFLMNQDIFGSQGQEKSQISDYKRRPDQPENLAEVDGVYCECAAGFSHDVRPEAEGYSMRGADFERIEDNCLFT